MRKAVILCAGKGTRLRPFTDKCPKVMINVGGRPMLAHHIDLLRQYNITEIYVNLHYLPDVITDYLGDGKRFGVQVNYSYEETLCGTAGALRAFRNHLDDTFVVHYGDVFSEIDLRRMLRFHREVAAAATLATQPTDRLHDSDIVRLDARSRVISFHERPGDSRFGHFGNAASYILEPVVMEYISEEDGEVDFIQSTFPTMLDASERLYGYLTDELLFDMGTVQRCEYLRRTLARRR
jgi:NDP-sugar pyrophosphorylase family protein